MDKQFERTKAVFGDEYLIKLKNKRVAVFGIGGVGYPVCEALVRCGINYIDIIDCDTFSITNINRQILADHSTIGALKVDIAEKRLKLINPNCKVTKHNLFFMPENSHLVDFSQFDYVVDAVDTITAKIEIINKSIENNVGIISSMGTGNKIDPTAFEITDIYKTSVCPLAKVMRHELKKRNIKKLKVLYSKEIPSSSNLYTEFGKSIPGSVSFVPPVAGYIIAGEVIKDLLKED